MEFLLPDSSCPSTRSSHKHIIEQTSNVYHNVQEYRATNIWFLVIIVLSVLQIAIHHLLLLLSTCSITNSIYFIFWKGKFCSLYWTQVGPVLKTNQDAVLLDHWNQIHIFCLPFLKLDFKAFLSWIPVPSIPPNLSSGKITKSNLRMGCWHYKFDARCNALQIESTIKFWFEIQIQCSGGA